jgi:Phage Mu protein F like protein
LRDPLAEIRNYAVSQRLSTSRAAPPPPIRQQPWQVTWSKGIQEIDLLVSRGDWHSARAALQHAAYGMLDAPPAEKQRFTQAMCLFAKRDPLYHTVMAVVTPLVAQAPGILQSKLYPHLPSLEPEMIRYVLYYAAELGDIVRLKKGNSYALRPSLDRGDKDVSHSATAVPTLAALASWANIDVSLLQANAKAIGQAIQAGDSTQLDRVLRDICPTEAWAWPAYSEYAARTNEKPTRLRMVAAVAHAIERQVMFTDSLAQLMGNVSARPIWQLRAVCDGRDPEECEKLDGQTARYDDQFWLTNGPTQCEKVYCRCSIRAYSPGEVL